MPKRVETLLKIYLKELERVTDDKIKKVILYGSYARGDFHQDSDVDVMILVDALVDAIVDGIGNIEKKICDVTYDFNNEYEMDIVPVVQSKGHFDYWKNADMFYHNVDKEGVVI